MSKISQPVSQCYLQSTSPSLYPKRRGKKETENFTWRHTHPPPIFTGEGAARQTVLSTGCKEELEEREWKGVLNRLSEKSFHSPFTTSSEYVLLIGQVQVIFIWLDIAWMSGSYAIHTWNVCDILRNFPIGSSVNEDKALTRLLLVVAYCVTPFQILKMYKWHFYRKERKLQFYWLSPVNITVQFSSTCSDQFQLSLDSAEAGKGITLRILRLVSHWMQCYKQNYWHHFNHMLIFKRQKTILKSTLYIVNFYGLPRAIYWFLI